MNDARCNLLFVEDAAALDKIWPAVEKVSSLKAIVQVRPLLLYSLNLFASQKNLFLL